MVDLDGKLMKKMEQTEVELDSKYLYYLAEYLKQSEYEVLYKISCQYDLPIYVVDHKTGKRTDWKEYSK